MMSQYIIELLQKAGYWERLLELLKLLEAGDKNFRSSRKSFLESVKSIKETETSSQSSIPTKKEEPSIQSSIPQKDETSLRGSIPKKEDEPFILSSLDVHIQDDLLMTFDKDARKDLKKANKWMKSEEFSRKRKYHLPPQKSLSGVIDPEYLKKRNLELLQSKERAEQSSDKNYKSLRQLMMTLPVRNYGDQVLDIVKNNTYSILVAETGSGKSTQVPQLILEDAVTSGAGAECKILCVQPRQIAATSLASRVADERLERIGETVGYTVRFDSCPPPDAGSIKYCTTGIFLNITKDGPDSLRQFSHIVLDEVHTRDTQLDTTMMLLKRAIEHCQRTGVPVPKVVLMSATVDVDLFASYFSTKTPDGLVLPAPHLFIPGRTFEVKKHYLEEVVHNITHSLPPDVLSVLLRGDTRFFLNNHFKAFGSPDQEDTCPPEAEVLELGEVNVPSGLVSAAILSLLATTKEGSILAFVPGMKQIHEVTSQLQELGPRFGFDFEDSDRFKIIRLHSDLRNEQREMSVPTPQSCRRIIISTDIAEASLTIPDVRCVVDSGKVNQMNFDTEQKLGELAPRWISKSSALQRAGRAGRTQAGDYYFLGSSQQFDALRITRSPEIRRSNLEELCLHAKKATLGTSDSISDVLAQTIEPPNEARVRAALDSLIDLKALDDQEEFTGLGHILEQLDMDPAFGKMVVLGVIFRCLDAMVILASLGPRSGFFERPSDGAHRKRIMKSRSTFQQGLRSDHMILINAYRAVRDQDPGQSAAEFCQSSCLDFSVFKQAASAGRQIMMKLHRAKLIERPLKRDTHSLFGGSNVNINSDNAHLIKALLVHCLSPNLAVKCSGSSIARIKPGVPVTTQTPSQKAETAIFAFSNKWSTKENPLGISELTQVRPLAACLLASKLKLAEDMVVLDSWLGVKIKSEGFSKEEVSQNLIEQHELLNKVSILPFFNTSRTNIMQALHTAFETLPRKSFKRGLERQAYLRARNALFRSLENTMGLILDMDVPPAAPTGPKYWD
jgi:HrpA-like RNA helicase